MKQATQQKKPRTLADEIRSRVQRVQRGTLSEAKAVEQILKHVQKSIDHYIVEERLKAAVRVRDKIEENAGPGCCGGLELPTWLAKAVEDAVKYP